MRVFARVLNTNSRLDKETYCEVDLTSQAPNGEFTSLMPIIGLKIIATSGCVLTIASLFLPWVTTSALFSSVSHTGFDYLNSNAFVLAVLVSRPIVDSVLIWTEFRSLHDKGWSCIFLACSLGLFAYLLFNGMQEWISLSLQLHARIDSGFYLLPIGLFIVFLSGIILLLATRKTRISTPTPQTR